MKTQSKDSDVSMSRGGLVRRTDVRTWTLDQFVIQHELKRLDLIKVDIQGAEPAFLAGAENTLNSLSPD